MTGQATKSAVATALEEAINGMDRNEKAMLLHTLRMVVSYKSNAAKDRRLGEFKDWLDEYRAEKAQA